MDIHNYGDENMCFWGKKKPKTCISFPDNDAQPFYGAEKPQDYCFDNTHYQTDYPPVDKTWSNKPEEIQKLHEVLDIAAVARKNSNFKKAKKILKSTQKAKNELYTFFDKKNLWNNKTCKKSDYEEVQRRIDDALKSLPNK